MTKYNVEEFKAWLRKNNLTKFISTADYSHQNHGSFDNYVKKVISGKVRPSVEYNTAILQWMFLVDQTDYQQAITTQEQTNHQKQQRIFALEADKQDLLHQLTQAQQKYQDHLHQEKQLIQQEIKLIKEVLHV